MGKKVIPLRVVLDTNVLVSSLLFGGEPGRLHDCWVAKRLALLVSKETYTEFSKVLNYPKFRLNPAEISAIIENELLPFAEVIDVVEEVSGVCRDPDDDKFLAVAASGRAEYLITGDQDLLVLQSIGETRIVTVAEFSALIGT